MARKPAPCTRPGCAVDCPLCGVHVYRSHACSAPAPRRLTPTEVPAAAASARAALRAATTRQEVIPLA